jgi:hypothetical protein
MPFVDSVDVNFDALREVAFGSIGANYAIIGTAFTKDVTYLDIYNGTNQDIRLSDNGTRDIKYLPQGATWVWDISTNGFGPKKLLFPRSSALYQKRGGAVSPTSGSLFVTIVYAL